MLEGAGSRRSRQGRARGTVRHMLPPALPSHAEHGVLRLSPALLGFPGQEPLQAWPVGTPPLSLLGHGAGLPGWQDARDGNQGGHSRLAAWHLPGGGRIWARQGQLLPRVQATLAAKTKAPQHLGGLQGSANHAARHGSGHVQLCPTRAKQTNTRCTGPEREGWLSQPPPQADLPHGAGEGRAAGGMALRSHTHTSLTLTRAPARGPSPRQCLLVAPAHSAGRNALPGPAAPGCPLRPGSISSSRIAAAK